MTTYTSLHRRDDDDYDDRRHRRRHDRRDSRDDSRAGRRRHRSRSNGSTRSSRRDRRRGRDADDARDYDVYRRHRRDDDRRAHSPLLSSSRAATEAAAAAARAGGVVTTTTRRRRRHKRGGRRQREARGQRALPHEQQQQRQGVSTRHADSGKDSAAMTTTTTTTTATTRSTGTSRTRGALPPTAPPPPRPRVPLDFSCFICLLNHWTVDCPRLREAPEAYPRIDMRYGCWRCGERGHPAVRCTVRRYRCAECGGVHYTPQCAYDHVAEEWHEFVDATTRRVFYTNADETVAQWQPPSHEMDVVLWYCYTCQAMLPNAYLECVRCRTPRPALHQADNAAEDVDDEDEDEATTAAAAAAAAANDPTAAAPSVIDDGGVVDMFATDDDSYSDSDSSSSSTSSSSSSSSSSSVSATDDMRSSAVHVVASEADDDDVNTTTMATTTASHRRRSQGSTASTSTRTGTHVSRSLSPEQRRAMDEAIRAAFQEAQRSRRTRQVRHLTLGKGLGSEAEDTLQAGSYEPRSVFAHRRTANNDDDDDDSDERCATPHSDKEKGDGHDSGSRRDEADVVAVGAPTHRASTATPQAQHTHDGDKNEDEDEDEDNSNSNSRTGVSPRRAFLQRIRRAYTAAASPRVVGAEVQCNLTAAADALDALCAPYTFVSVLDTLAVALAAVDRGSAREAVVLPLRKQQPGQEREAVTTSSSQAVHHDNDGGNGNGDSGGEVACVCLTGAQAVMTYVRATLLPLCFAVVPTTHAVQWVVQYTMTFLRTLCARDDDEAALRLRLLAQCARLLGQTEQFAALLLTLEGRAGEYAAVDTLRQSATAHLTSLLDRVEATLTSVLALPFPLRRARLQRVEAAVRATLQRAVQLLSELEYSWSPTVRIHAAWQRRFLREQYARIHTHLAPRYIACTLGFIDEVLYRPVRDARITGRSKSYLLPHSPTVPVAMQVQYNRVVERLSFAQIAMEVKGLASCIAGHQLCMGARYVLRESTSAHDAAWGFAMSERMDVATAAEVAAKVAQWLGTVRAHVRETMADTPHTQPPTQREHNADDAVTTANDDSNANVDIAAAAARPTSSSSSSSCATFLTQGAAVAQCEAQQATDKKDDDSSESHNSHAS